MSPEELLVIGLRWRTGQKLGRTIYAQISHEPSDRDMLIGLMDTAEFAAHVVEVHNKGIPDAEGVLARMPVTRPPSSMGQALR